MRFTKTKKRVIRERLCGNVSTDFLIKVTGIIIRQCEKNIFPCVSLRLNIITRGKKKVGNMKY